MTHGLSPRRIHARCEHCALNDYDAADPSSFATALRAHGQTDLSA